MMIYGDKKRLLSSIIGPSGDEVKPETSEPGGDELKMITRELIDAIHAKDTDSACEALRAAFSLLDSEPHEEGEHEGE